ncbi:MAG TPA: prepilin peptidase [Xanthobacteraceae bacterium]|nr:prepilin peptidase [Xanthobacteraceae bacterium]
MFADAIRLLLFPGMMAFAASTDLFTMKISNRIPLILVCGFCALAAFDGTSIVDVGSHFAAGSVVLLVCFAFFSLGWIGGGDAKLAAATTLWLGWAHLFEYVVCASLFGGALTLLLLEFRKRLLPPMLARQAWLSRLHEPNGGVPYGIALAAAALVVYPTTIWMSPGL